MRASLLSLGLVGLAAGQMPTYSTLAPPLMGSLGNTTVAGNGTAVNQTDGKYTISAEGIRMNFVPYGASISNLFMNDSNGIERDIVLGWDNASYYTEDAQHPYFGPVPGRYANRIANSSFELDGVTYNVPPNEHTGTPLADALHGGLRGWSWRNWTVTAHTTDSITFSLVSPDGDQGFPGEVISYVTYTAEPYTWYLRMTAISTEKRTPIMLTSHTYWNLDGFQNPDTNTIFNHTLNLPYSGQYIAIDGTEIPTGYINPIDKYSALDFYTAPKQLGANFSSPQLVNNCGDNCTGYDNAWLINRQAYGNYDWEQFGPVASLASAFTGIQVDIYTNQDAFQVYTCNGQNGTTTLKSTQGFFGNSSAPRIVPQYGCVVMEVEDWIDGINQPEWGRAPKQIFGPADPPYHLEARYSFSVKGQSTGNDLGNGGMGRRRY